MNILARIYLLLCFIALHPPHAAAQTLEWVRSASGEDGGFAWDVGVDGAGNVYLTGGFALELDFDGDGAPDVADAGFGDIFLAKYDSQGELQWVVAPGGAGNDQGRSIVVDPEGNSYITGYVQEDADFDGDGATDVTVTGFDHLFLVKFDSGGALQWVRSVCGRGEGVALDMAGNVYITGLLAFCADFDGDGSADITGSGPFVAKYDQAGKFLWFRVAETSGIGEGSGVAVDATGHVYYTGFIDGDADFSGDGIVDLTSTSSIDMFLAKYDPTGSFQWVRSAGSSSGGDYGHDLAVSSAGAVFVTGLFEGAADFSGDGAPDVNDTGSGDAFVARYDADGVLQWVKSFGGTDVDESLAIATDEEAVYVTGTFVGAIDLDGDGTVDIAGIADIFLVQYEAAGVLQGAESGGGPQSDYVRGLAVDENGSIYLAGSYTGEMDFNGDGVPDVKSSRGPFAEELFVAKFAAGDATALEPRSPGEVPVEIVLAQNYPNPFNPRTTIRFSVLEAAPVTLTVYDLMGRRIAVLVDQVLVPGVYEVVWQAYTDTGTSMASGLFVYWLTAGAHSVSRAMSLLR